MDELWEATVIDPNTIDDDIRDSIFLAYREYKTILGINDPLALELRAARINGQKS